MSGLRFHVRLWPTVGTAVGLAILLSLGTWQASRFLGRNAEEKLRDQNIDLPVVSVSSLDELADGDLDFRQIQLTGRFDASELHLIKHRIHNQNRGYWLVSPLILEGSLAEPREAILVNRGWFPHPEGPELAIDFVASQEQTDPVTVTGLLHKLERVVVDPDTRAEALARSGELVEWESYDVTGIAQSLPHAMPPRPLILTLSTAHSGSPYPEAGYQHITEPYLTAEKHLGYCLTWYTLALALVAMYIAHGLGLLGSRRMADKQT